MKNVLGFAAFTIPAAVALFSLQSSDLSEGIASGLWFSGAYGLGFLIRALFPDATPTRRGTCRDAIGGWWGVGAASTGWLLLGLAWTLVLWLDPAAEADGVALFVNSAFFVGWGMAWNARRPLLRGPSPCPDDSS